MPHSRAEHGEKIDRVDDTEVEAGSGHPAQYIAIFIVGIPRA